MRQPKYITSLQPVNLIKSVKFERKNDEDINSNACLCTKERRQIFYKICVFEGVRYFQPSIIIHGNYIKV